MKTEKDLKDLEKWLENEHLLDESLAFKFSVTGNLYIEAKAPKNVAQALKTIPILIAELRKARKQIKRKKKSA